MKAPLPLVCFTCAGITAPITANLAWAQKASNIQPFFNQSHYYKAIQPLGNHSSSPPHMYAKY